MKSTRALLFAAFAAVRLIAADAEDAAARLTEMRQLADGLRPAAGKITLHGGLAELNLPEGFRYLSPEDTETVLTKIWRNPKSDSLLGMIVPAGFDPIAGESWAVVVSFEEDGYVNDDDAAKIDYADLLKDMKAGTKEASAEREKAGYPAIELIGWAAPPRYDAAAHKLYWAKEIKFGTETEHTLNYNIRMLGRRGVLVLNVVAAMPQLAEVEQATPALLAMVDFQPGHRYADFNAATDKTATYGIAALVAGGVAAKTGFFKALWLGILAFKKVIFFALLALAGSAKQILAWIRGRDARPAAAATPSDGKPPAA